MSLGGKDTIRFLIIDSSLGEAEAFLNVFRESGYATRANLVNSLDELNEAFSKRQQWDLLLITEPQQPLTVPEIFDCISQKDVDLPAIVLASSMAETDALGLIKMGARAVIPLENEDYLLTTALRELDDLKIRRHHRRMSIALNESENQRRLLLDDQSDAVVYINNGRIQYANCAFSKLLGGFDTDALDGMRFKELINSKDQQDVEEFLTGIEESGQALAVIQCPLVGKDGTEIPTRAVISPTSYNGEFTLSLQIKLNEPEAQSSVKKTIEKNAPDRETGLLNRQQFERALGVAIQKAVSGKRKSTLCCLQVETLKAIHQQHGKEVSQKLLKTLAATITTHLGGGQSVASIGGGNFGVLLREGDEQQVQQITDGLIKLTSAENIIIDQHSLPVEISFGAVILSETASDAKSLLVQCRQAALIGQKEGLKLRFYQKRKVKVVSSVENKLAGMVSEALQKKQFSLNFQPVVALAGSAAEYYEVSFSMTDDEGEEHDAATFRPKLEKVDLWNKVDRWQLIEASKALMEKRKDGRDTRLLMHIGGFSATDESFLPWMKVALKAAGIPPAAVAIELSEQNLARYNKVIPGFFRSLKEMGCQTVVSEFGCSLKPLEAIKHLNVDFVKIDNSFTQRLHEQDNARELQELIQSLCDAGKKVIVPGIQSAEEMTPVWQFGADFIQGSYMQPPSAVMNFDFGADG